MPFEPLIAHRDDIEQLYAERDRLWGDLLGDSALVTEALSDLVQACVATRQRGEEGHKAVAAAQQYVQGLRERSARQRHRA